MLLGELLSLSSSFGGPIRSDVQMLVPNETYLRFIVKNSLILSQENNSWYNTEFSQLCDVNYRSCLLHQMILIGIQPSVCSPNIICWRFHMFSKVKKHSDSLLEYSCFILTIWFFHKLGRTFTSVRSFTSFKYWDISTAHYICVTYSELSCWIRNSRFQVNWWHV